jgi:hypothetical protein
MFGSRPLFFERRIRVLDYRGIRTTEPRATEKTEPGFENAGPGMSRAEEFGMAACRPAPSRKLRTTSRIRPGC